MELTVLVDNNTLNDKYYIGEPAVCYYIVDGDNKILFDTGYSDAFIKNASSMGIDIQNVDSIVISHGHEDHSNGLKYYLDSMRDRKIKLISHPLTFNKKKLDNEMICSPYSLELLGDYFDILVSKEPLNISENLVYLGEIPHLLDFEERCAMGKIKIDGNYVDDYLYDDSSVVYKSSEGLIIIAGCSHSGICNIIEYAKKVCNDSRIYGVIGGFHLTEINSRLNETIEYFKKNNIKKVMPCHCTSLTVKSQFVYNLGEYVEEVGVGYKIIID